MKDSGYSGKPLAKKLGIKDGSKIKLINQPKYYHNLFDEFPVNVEVVADLAIKKKLIHYFAKDFAKLDTLFYSPLCMIIGFGLVINN